MPTIMALEKDLVVERRDVVSGSRGRLRGAAISRVTSNSVLGSGLIPILSSTGKQAAIRRNTSGGIQCQRYYIFIFTSLI